MKCPHCKKPYLFRYEKIDVERFKQLVNQDVPPKEIAFQMGINSSTVYKYLFKMKAKKVYRILDEPRS